jgi:hypothetical protein
MKTKALVQVLFAMMLCNCIYSQYFTEISKFGYPYNAFGYSLCFSDTVLLIGSPYECYDINGENRIPGAGAAYLFQHDDNSVFTPVQKLIVSDREPGDYFGNAVSISGNYLIIGAEEEAHDEQGQDSVLYAGSAYIFERDETNLWKQVQKIVASDRIPYSRFGCSVNISENYAMVGAQGVNSAYVFKRDSRGKWSQIQIIKPFDDQESCSFGGALGISGEYVIIGAPNTYGSSGAAYIFKRNGSEIWEPVQKLEATDGVSDACFGSSVNMSNNYAVVAASQDYLDADGNGPLPNTGSVYVFKRQTSGEWIQEEKLCASDRSADAVFGNSVGISENRIIVGAIQDSHDSQGGNTINKAGSAYLFQKDNHGKWQEIQKFTSSGRVANGRFGSSVSISGDRIIIGATGESQVFVFKETCVPFVIPDPDNIIENGDFGSCNLSPWTIYENLGVTANGKIENGKFSISEITLSNTPESWHLQPVQELSAEQLSRLEIGETYTISFDAFAETINRPCVVVLGQNEVPYTTVFADNILVSTEERNYSFDFILSQKFSKMKFSFDIGQESSALTFDNVRLVKKANPVSSLTAYPIENTKVYPNPVEKELHIEAVNGSVVQLINAFGIVVQTISITNKAYILNVQHLPEGIYLLVIKKNNFVSQHKIIIR